MTKTDKETRLADKALVGERMRAFLADPIIKQWFDDAITRGTERVIDAAVADDDKLRTEALTVKVLKELWRFMQHAEVDGRRSAEELSNRNKQKVES